MPNWNINLVNRLGKGGGVKNTGNPNSVSNKKVTIKESATKFNLSNPTNSIISGIGSGSGKELGGLGGALGKAGIVATAVVATVKTANKVADLVISYKTAKTGNSLYYGNVKSAKDTIMQLGTNYLFGWINNELYNKNVVRRQNASLEYGRELYNYNNYGSKYKTR